MSQNVEPTSPYIIKIQEQYNVQVMMRTRPKLHATLVLVKGVEWEVDQVKRATLMLVDYMCENLAVSIIYVSSLLSYTKYTFCRTKFQSKCLWKYHPITILWSLGRTIQI